MIGWLSRLIRGAAASGHLLSAGPGEQVAFDIGPGIDERRGDALGEVLQCVGDLGAGPGRQRDVVQFVDCTDRRSSITALNCDDSLITCL